MDIHRNKVCIPPLPPRGLPCLVSGLCRYFCRGSSPGLLMFLSSPSPQNQSSLEPGPPNVGNHFMLRLLFPAEGSTNGFISTHIVRFFLDVHRCVPHPSPQKKNNPQIWLCLAWRFLFSALRGPTHNVSENCR